VSAPRPRRRPLNTGPPSFRRDRPSFAGRTAIAGVGYTPLTKDSGTTVLALAASACRAAIEDSGLERTDVDGVASYSLFNDSISCQALASAIALPELRYALDLNLGGQAPAFAVLNAAMAVEAGMADVVVVFRALNGRSGVRIGAHPFAAPTAQYRYPIGFTAYVQYMAMLARRFMITTGATHEDLAGVVIQQRRYAAANERAVRRNPIGLEEYMAAPFVAEPFRTVDCTTEVDGACAVVVTSLERARTLRHPPAVIEGGAWSTPASSGLDIADLLLHDDYATNAMHFVGRRLWQATGMQPRDIDVAEIYDCFSSTVLFALEGLGFVGKGESGSFVRSGGTTLTGQLPVNTHGGLLNEGYVHGMNTLAEGALQVQGRGGPARQVPDAATCLVTSGALTDGSALILSRGEA
jgi:acetyl-CoA acetyltransferase